MLKDLVKERLGIDEIGIYQIGATIGVAAQDHIRSGSEL